MASRLEGSTGLEIMCDERRKTSLVKMLAIIGLLSLLCMGASEGGCAGQDMSTDAGGDVGPTTVDQRLLDAQAALAQHDVEGAQAIYGQLVAEGQDAPGSAFAGKAITDLLLLPGSQPARTMLVEHLGATSGIDANDAIYAEEGFLYWQVRGVPWNDDGEYLGIRSLIADELPWSTERLDGLRLFFTGLDSSGNEMMDDLVVMADAMAQIENDLQRALDDDSFEFFYVPGLTFHDDDLDLLLGRSELHALSSFVAATRASIYFLAAYDHTWTLDAMLGSQAEARAEPKDGWQTADYALDYLDGRLFRQVRDPLRLEESREAFDASLESAIASVEAGMNSDMQTTLRWKSADKAYAEDLIVFLEEVQSSLDGSVELTGSTPKTSMDLSSFFDGVGRTLPAEIRWFERIEPTPESDNTAATDAYWQVSDASLQAFMVDGVFEPGFSIAEGNGPDLQIDDERGRKFRNAVTGDVERDVENAYFTTQ